MTTTSCLATFSLLSALQASAYNLYHGPFEDTNKIQRIPLVKLTCQEAAGGGAAYTFPIGSQGKSALKLTVKDKFCWVGMLIDGKTALKPTHLSTYIGLGTGFQAAYSADLNRDGQPDYLVYSYSGGCGLAGGYCNIAFILSTGTTYNVTVVSTLWPDDINYVILNGKPYFVHTSFHGAERCADAKPHNFWLYNLLALGRDGTLKVANEGVRGFPKTIWFSFRENHQETTLLTPGQKKQFLQWTLSKEIFWTE
jgi:hypothetical protein